MLRYSKINELPPADDYNVNTLHNWLRNPESENGELHIHGPGSDSWGKLEHSLPPRPKTPWQQFINMLRSVSIFWAVKPPRCFNDLVVPGKSRNVDGLTRWVTNEWIPFWHSVQSHSYMHDDPEVALPVDEKDETRRRSRVSSASTLVQLISRTFIRRRSLENTNKKRSTLITYRIGTIMAFTSFVTTVLAACFLPTASIAILSTAHSTGEVLGFIGLFTALFSMTLMLLTDSETSRTQNLTSTVA